MALSDTSQEALRVYVQRLAEMTSSERVDLSAALWASANALQHAAVRRIYPGADEAEIAYRIAITRFGAELAGKAYRR